MEQAIDLDFNRDLSALGNPIKWRQKEWQKAQSIGVDISCNHPNCRNTKTISCSSPIQYRYALKSAGCEIFYCPAHRGVAWEKLEVISDYLLPYLSRVQKLGVCNKSQSGLKEGAIDFLVEIGLLSLVPTQHGANTVYRLKITDEGERLLAKNAEQLDLYMSHQVRDSQLEWNWVPSNTHWSDGAVV